MLSRRRFLQLAGITVSAAVVPGLGASPADAAPSFEPVFGRALDTVPIYAAPDGPEIARLWSDSVTPILSAEAGWYRLPSGYARREALQPLFAPARRSVVTSAPPFWGSVSGAVAVVRAYCAADAPILTRLGHGGVLRVIDLLPDDDLDWYGVAEAENAELLGWTQAADWSPATLDDALPTLTLDVDRASQRLTVRDGTHVLLAAPVSAGLDLPAGVYPLANRTPAQAQGDYHGAPWLLRFGAVALTGAYWHNRFGSATAGTAVQVTPPLAQWLYPRAAEIIVY